jgi:hypothetical protein
LNKILLELSISTPPTFKQIAFKKKISTPALPKIYLGRKIGEIDEKISIKLALAIGFQLIEIGNRGQLRVIIDQLID